MSSSRAYPYLIGGLMGCTLGLIILLVGIIGGVGPLAGLATGASHDDPSAGALDRPTTAGADILEVVQTERTGAIVQATHRASPAVVSIMVFDHQYVRTRASILERLFQNTPGRTSVQQQTYVRRGSGVIIDRGLVVTNDHLFDNIGNHDISVTLPDGRYFSAKLEGQARKYDLAVLRITDSVDNLPVAKMGDSNKLVTGEWAIAIGSPYGDIMVDPAPTVTVGVISAVHRDVPRSEDGGRDYLDMVQTDAAINDGNSGGALVNARGEVVGINTFIISAGGGSVGLGFAVPINRVRWVVEEILEKGRLAELYEGFLPVLIDERTRRRFRFADGSHPEIGLHVERVTRDGPADTAGLQDGDIILTIQGNPVLQRIDYIRHFWEARAGTELELEVSRPGDKVFQTTLVLQELPPWRNR